MNSITRFCFVRLTAEASARRDELARALTAALRDACAPHPTWVGVPGDDSAARWDLGMTIALPDLAAWHALAVQPAFLEVMREVAERAEVVKAWTFALPS